MTINNINPKTLRFDEKDLIDLDKTLAIIIARALAQYRPEGCPSFALAETREGLRKNNNPQINARCDRWDKYSKRFSADGNELFVKMIDYLRVFFRNYPKQGDMLSSFYALEMFAEVFSSLW